MNLLKIITLLGCFVVSSHAREFLIKPYPLINEKGEILINFKLKEDAVLSISNSNKESLVAEYKEYKKKSLHKINIGSLNCLFPKRIEITEKISRSILYQATLPESLCRTFDSERLTKEKKKYVFGFMSDTQEYKERHNSVANVIKDLQTQMSFDFILNAGDVVQDGDVEQQWIDFFDVSTTYLHDTPIIAAIGNHDYRGSKGAKLPPLFKKYLRWENSQQYGNYALNLGEFKILVFNSNFFRLDKKEEKDMLVWFNFHLRQSKKNNQPVILLTHFPIYSSSINKFTSMSVQKLRRKIVPIIEKYGVKIILSGHTHMYERSLKRKSHYIVAGPAGGRVNSPTWKNKYSVYLNEDVLTFSVMTIENGIFEMKTYDENSKIIDELKVSLLD